MSTKALELAYQGLTLQLNDQGQALTNVRNRTVGLMSAAAVLVTFATSVGVINTDPQSGPVTPGWLSLAVMLSLVGILVLVLFVLWPLNLQKRSVDFEAFVKSEYDDDDAVLRKLISDVAAVREGSRSGLYMRQMAQIGIVVLLVLAVLLLLVSVLLK